MLTNAMAVKAATSSRARRGVQAVRRRRAAPGRAAERPSKTFRMKYQRKGKEQLLTFGQWPELSLTDARTRRDQVRDQRGAALT
jgi:hypothetical protein